MNKKIIAGSLVILLTATLVMSAVFFTAPRKVSAQASAVSCLMAAISAGPAPAAAAVSVPVFDAANLVPNVSAAGSSMGDCITNAILMPLARLLARMVLQKITASVVNWINGGNGTGQPSFVMNLSVHLQSVGDAAAIPFLNQIRTGLNSPFGSAIAYSLQNNYLQQSSMGGFLAANQCTLSKASPNINGFLAGDWSQGGVAAWLALTTENQNNPYTLYQAAQNQLGSNVTQAQTNRRQDLMQSGGFLSWCGGNTTPSIGSVNPTAPCTNPNGTPANAMTPGSVIHDYTQKALVSVGMDQLVAATDIDSAIGTIATALINNVLGQKGLFGTSQSSNTRAAFTLQMQTTPTDNQSSTASVTSLAQSVITQVGNYSAAWNSINAAANSASTNLTTIIHSCQDSGTVTAAQNALVSEVNPVLAQAQTALNTVATTQALATRAQSDAAAAASGTTVDSTTLANDTQQLASAPPSIADITDAQSNATVLGKATASPAGSLTVSGSTLIDQMNLISQNAVTIQNSAVCTPPPQSINNGYDNNNGNGGD